MSKLKIAKNGKIYLNLGCGGVYSPEWNNLDLYRAKDVVYHDLNKGIPYSDNIFDAVYSSHVLEHFSREKGEFLLKEIFRVLKPRGIVRLVLPDLEGIVREYLRHMGNFRKEPSKQNWQRYYWSVFELYDQAVRKVSGGEMLKALISGDVDWEYVASRAGDEFSDFYPWNKQKRAEIKIKLPLWRKILNRFKSLFRSKDPRRLGELHQWMYDSIFLTHLLKNYGFTNINQAAWNVSGIPDWQMFNLDESRDGDNPRKPDSFYLEGIKS